MIKRVLGIIDSDGRIKIKDDKYLVFEIGPDQHNQICITRLDGNIIQDPIDKISNYYIECYVFTRAYRLGITFSINFLDSTIKEKSEDGKSIKVTLPKEIELNEMKDSEIKPKEKGKSLIKRFYQNILGKPINNKC